MDNYIGYLSPDGEFFPCMYYGHLEKAKDIVYEIYGKNMNGAVAEDYLYNLGRCIFYSRHFGCKCFVSGIKEPLNPRLRDFLLDSLKYIMIEDKLFEIKHLLKIDEICRNFLDIS